MVLSICIVNWNGSKFIIDCIESIKRNNLKLSFEIIVVDNDSHDGSPQMIASKFPDVKLILNKKNYGFSKANNIAISNSKGRYILLLNSDTLIKANSIENLVLFMEQNPEIGICGPKLIHPESQEIELSYRSFPKLLPLFWNLTYLDRLFPKSKIFAKYLMTYTQFESSTKVDWVTGACLLTRRTTVEDCGQMDSKIFMYCEDIDWCFRFTERGYTIFYVPEVSVYHYKGLSSKQKRTSDESGFSVWGAQMYTKSIIYFYNKHYGLVSSLTLRIIIILSALIKSSLWLIKGLLDMNYKKVTHRAMCYISTVPIALGYKNISTS